ncbi:LLM class flavin-dependent oxidoreductase [Yinghuangia soli]|uniref:LLM class flavin-dependent oxidoreductase n=1 Tax=Yinghuangia soli TaxID=2908204 RepID=A0AA41U5F0_9ACTN|nr:LLM class flavin-dependent oxidoreductase [Yinghuangia soli]MCF2531857.1 LLM class flavin-dependent oxidoreductase [Yinghuangia soli]
MHLAVQFPGGCADFAAYERIARTAERGKFDFCLLGDGDFAGGGGPDTVTVLSALAAVTHRIGLAATATAVYSEPYEIARRIASLDHLSAGRAAWDMATSPDAYDSANYRRGDFLPAVRRHERADEFVHTVRAVWDAWAPGAVAADQAGGVFADPGGLRPFAFHGRYFSVSGHATLPRSPQGNPVLIHAGDADEARDFGAAHADVVRTACTGLDEARAFAADLEARAAGHARGPGDVRVMLDAGFVLGGSEADARGRGLQAGLPDADRPVFAGSAAHIAARMDAYVQEQACDGFVLQAADAPDGSGSAALTAFVDQVVPLLRDRGSFRADYTGWTLRDHLGLPVPAPLP